MSVWNQFRIIPLAATLVGAFVFVACGDGMAPTATPAPTPAPTLAPTATPMPTPTPAPSIETSTPATTFAITVAPIGADIPEYERSQYKHWVDEDGDCQDARQEVLVLESLVEVTFESEKECRVATGRWYGAFTGTYVETPGEFDIDHLVPLKNAHNSGGWGWSSAKKQEYANDLANPDHLIAVTKGANRSKGAKGPEDWRPPNENYWCQYATDWTEVKAEWGLTMTQSEAEAIIEMLDTCTDPIGVEIQEAEDISAADETTQPEATDITETTMPERESEEDISVYGSCEEAKEAVESRVQGSSGGGRGFPQAMVPSARDGDGDGVVCEQ